MSMELYEMFATNKVSRKRQHFFNISRTAESSESYLF